jgi:hypothetical protein
MMRRSGGRTFEMFAEAANRRINASWVNPLGQPRHRSTFRLNFDRDAAAEPYPPRISQRGEKEERKMRRTMFLAGAYLMAAVFVGGFGIVQQTFAAEPNGGTPENPGSTKLTVQECTNLGCTWVEAPSCPLVMHDYALRHWACKCPGGTSCIDESSAH